MVAVQVAFNGTGNREVNFWTAGTDKVMDKSIFSGNLSPGKLENMSILFCDLSSRLVISAMGLLSLISDFCLTTVAEEGHSLKKGSTKESDRWE